MARAQGGRQRVAPAPAGERRRRAEKLYETLSQDLRFSDTKAGVVVVLAGAWLLAVHTVAGLQSSSLDPFRSEWTRLFCEWVALPALASILTAVWSTVPQGLVTHGGSLHHVHTLADRVRRERVYPDAVHTDLAVALGSAEYDLSLVKDLARVAQRCSQRYGWVEASMYSLALELVGGAAVVVLRLAFT